MIKFNSLLANCVIFPYALDITDVLRELVAEGGWDEEVTAANIAQLSPYINEHIARFGVYATDVLKLRPEAFDPELAEVDFDALQDAA
jgi:Tn3 transposase DDE domain